ncbi:MAG: ABC transporter substrate-binding protein [Pseudolabrys sp.]
MRITHVFCRRYRGVILGLLAAALVRDSAGAQTSVKFTLDWKFEGPAAPFLVAVDRGYFTAEKLEVTIEPGNGSLEPINRVASGSYDIGFGDINTLIKFRDRKRSAPLKAVFMVYNKPPQRDRRAQEPRHHDAERPGRKEARRAGWGCRFCGMAHLR